MDRRQIGTASSPRKRGEGERFLDMQQLVGAYSLLQVDARANQLLVEQVDLLQDSGGDTVAAIERSHGGLEDLPGLGSRRRVGLGLLG